jgi:hypothetical protein
MLLLLDCERDPLLESLFIFSFTKRNMLFLSKKMLLFVSYMRPIEALELSYDAMYSTYYFHTMN